MNEEDARQRRVMQARMRRRKRARNRRIIRQLVLLLAVLALGIFLGMRISALREKPNQETGMAKSVSKVVTEGPEFEVQLLTPNPYSRPQEALKEIKGIVVHYTANPGTTAQQNRDYFEGLKDAKTTNASSHFIVGLEGEIIQCIPSSEIAYASNERNADTISIECCHPGESGEFTKETYDALVHLIAWLCGKFDLAPDSVIRHYDVTGKNCPRYFVEHEDAWETFLKDVIRYIDQHGTEQEGPAVTSDPA